MKYLIEVEDQLWRSFKSICAVQGIKIKDTIRSMIEDFVRIQG